ncbi:MAG: hypothetical protein ACOVLC_03430 [Flavobacterium sp.]
MKCKTLMNQITLISLLLIAFTGFGQTTTPTKADKLFDDYKFNLAIKEYLNLSKSKRADSTYIQTRLADCYYQLYNYEQAIVWYSKALKNDSDPELNFRYAQMLKAAGDYAKASEQMTLFSKQRPEDPRAINFLKNPNYVNEVIERGARYTISPMALNPELDEFGGVLVENTFYFVSNRERKNAQKENSDQTGKNFTNVYTSNFVNGEATNINEFRELNTRWNDELLTVNKNKEVLYMSSENYSLNLSKNPKFKNMTEFSDGVFAIFKSTFESNSFWSNFEPLSFTEKEYSYSDPFLTADSKTLYFSSNMPGGFGGMDVWKVTILDDGSYSAPINLGNEINTITDDRYPFLDEQKNEFYSSSNGHLGLGGLDIFKVQLNSSIKKPINLLQPVNSSGNDFAFIYYNDRNVGFFSSNRDGNKNIYQIKEIPSVKVDFKVLEETNSLPIKNAKILVKDKSNNKVIDVVYTNENGQAMGLIQKNKEIFLEIETKNHVKEIQKILANRNQKRCSWI